MAADPSDVRRADDMTSVFYDGFAVLQPLADVVGIGVDRLNFVACLLLSMGVAHWYRKQLNSSDRATRANVASAVGFAMCYFCYGKASLHLLLNASISYVIMVYSHPKHVNVCVFIFAMGYLLAIHGYRWLYQKAYCLDMTGSMMVAVAKVTLLAASIHDGNGREPHEKMTPGQMRDAVRETPSIRDYFSYMFNFQTILCGPINNYMDYSRFLDRTHVEKANGREPSPTREAMRKVETALSFLLVFTILGQKFDVPALAREEYTSLPLWRWSLWLVFNAFIARTGYYFAWIFADGVCNMSGFGFRGFDKEGIARWDLTTNVRPYNVELGFNYKEMVDNWNVLTVAWLRRVVYERVDTRYRTVAVYATSAAWHGFAVGYYFSFLTSALFTLAAAMVRRCVRHRVLNDKPTKVAYDVVGFVACRMAISYVCYPFFTMDAWPSLFAYKKLWFTPHLVAAFCYFTLPKILPPPSKALDENNNTIDKGIATNRTKGRIPSDLNINLVSSTSNHSPRKVASKTSSTRMASSSSSSRGSKNK